ncbi:PREDICTED: translation initiation factor IF-2-like [Chinchilla lanigera]|uniref:translation initiation factor IF-2-like n=1 Tax=Chinchilla lanigera TaxID=34839 RepID=UPI000695BDFB|nr:PREDICTED: translation initiation factor IF-2-like [Chinchilla lanigera]
MLWEGPELESGSSEGKEPAARDRRGLGGQGGATRRALRQSPSCRPRPRVQIRRATLGDSSPRLQLTGEAGRLSPPSGLLRGRASRGAADPSGQPGVEAAAARTPACAPPAPARPAAPVCGSCRSAVGLPPLGLQLASEQEGPAGAPARGESRAIPGRRERPTGPTVQVSRHLRTGAAPRPAGLAGLRVPLRGPVRVRGPREPSLVAASRPVAPRLPTSATCPGCPEPGCAHPRRPAGGDLVRRIRSLRSPAPGLARSRAGAAPASGGAGSLAAWVPRGHKGVARP